MKTKQQLLEDKLRPLVRKLLKEDNESDEYKRILIVIRQLGEIDDLIDGLKGQLEQVYKRFTDTYTKEMVLEDIKDLNKITDTADAVFVAIHKRRKK